MPGGHHRSFQGEDGHQKGGDAAVFCSMLEANPGDAFADGKSAGPRGQDQIIARELPAIVVCSGLGGGVGGVESEKIG